MALTNSGILFLDRNGFLLFSDSINRVVQFNFPPNVVRDLEIIDHDQLAILIDTFFKQAGLAPFQLVILLSNNLLFEKVFTTPQDEKSQKDLELFMDNLPFEHVGSIIFTQNESKFIATNKDLYQGISKSFEKLSCVVAAIVPAFVIGLDINQMVQITPSLASDTYRRAVSLRQYSFLIDKPKAQMKPIEKSKSDDIQKIPGDSDDYVQPDAGQGKKEEKNNTRLFLLIGVFVVLIVLLIVAIFMFQ